MQTKNETNAQANVQIDVKFGQRGIRNAMQRSLDTAEVVLLSNNKEVIEKGASGCTMNLHSFRGCSFDSQPNSKNIK